MREAMRSTSAKRRRIVVDVLIFLEKNFDGFMPGNQNSLVPQRVVQPVAQQPAAHAGGALVQQREQRRRGLAAQRFGDFQVAARRRVHAQVFARALGAHRADVRERLALRFLRVIQQRAAGGDRRFHVLDAEAGERGGAQLIEQPLPPRFEFEIPCRQASHRVAGQLQAVRRENLRRRDAAQFVVERLWRYFRDPQFAACQR